MSLTFRQINDASSALDLLNDRYASCGYGASHDIPTGATFVAEEHGLVVATVTLVVEGRAAHLVRLASICNSAKVLIGLFKLAFDYGVTSFPDCEVLQIEVNPRHARFYERLFGFTKVGEPWTSEEFGDSISQLLELKVSDIRI